MNYLDRLPDSLLDEVETFLHYHDIILSLYSSAKTYYERRLASRSKLIKALSRMTCVILFDHEQDALHFLRNIEFIQDGNVPAFRQLPPFITERPLSYVFRSVLWSAIDGAQPTPMDIAGAGIEFSTNMLHTFRLNWRNTRAGSVMDEPSRLKIMTFLMSLHDYETELNKTLRVFLSRHIEKHPQIAQHLEPYISMEKLITIYARFEVVDSADIIKTKDFVVVIAFHRQLLDTISGVTNQLTKADVRRDFFRESPLKAYPFCTTCLLNEEHWSTAPASFSGTHRRWAYDKNGKRAAVNRCALFPVHGTESFHTYQTFLRYAPQVLPLDFDHVEDCDADNGNHMCGDQMRMRTLWPSVTEIQNPDRVDLMMHDAMLHFYR